MKKTAKWLLAAAALAAACAAAWYFTRDDNRISYLTETVKRTDISQTVSATGELTSSHWVDVGAQASGQIKRLHVKIGQQIKRGDLIAEIDSTTQLNTLNTQKAKLATHQAQLVSARIALSSAEKKLRREEALWREDATSRAELESAQDALAAARASVAELQSAIRQTKIAINTAESDLGYTRITAPMDGTVVAIPVEEGQTVNANQTAPTIIQLADLSRMLNRMQIAEGDITKVAPGQKVRFTILSEPDTPFETELDSIDPGLTTMSQGSYSTKTDTTDSAIYYYARAYVPNPEGRFAIGMTTQNTVEIKSAKGVLAVPTVTVKRREGKTYVRVLDGQGKAVEKEITTGLRDSMNTEVKSGLSEGERVVVSETGADERGALSQGVMGPPPRR
ncbi:efflux RND transporter periplasmic adaptor subunit [Neisseria leonii]|uniref:Efflux RND transporter periplasmic adaptor subunit n=1 Tax=Neisseria leonii TaxID=2995413 RepID=A0A9X4IBE6_9NEIS|nr:efflux RND transporter periplasmic adaptor subunit [Neisseria sp. 51.81]MDD9328330.1 efflux RND transporter periplasmic adaptor subunit [Neisseria sp. 51.81]